MHAYGMLVPSIVALDTDSVVVCRPMLENNKNPSKYIKYSPENIETKLGELFEGRSAAKMTTEPRRS